MGLVGLDKETVLVFLPLFPGTLSLVGSTLLARLLFKSKCRLPYRRILFVLSTFDILNTISICLGPFLFPKGSFSWSTGSQRTLYAIGTEATCVAIGFINQLSYVPSFSYYGVSSLYYLLRIRYGVRDEYFGRYIEPILHTFFIGYNFILAIIFAYLGLLGDPGYGFGCWIAPNPDIGCDVNCISTISWSVSGAMFFFIFAFLLVSNVLIYKHVRTTYVKSQRRSMAGTEVSDGQIRAVARQAFLYVLVFVSFIMLIAPAFCIATSHRCVFCSFLHTSGPSSSWSSQCRVLVKISTCFL